MVINLLLILVKYVIKCDIIQFFPFPFRSESSFSMTVSNEAPNSLNLEDIMDT